MLNPDFRSVFQGPSATAELRRLGIEEVDLVLTIRAAEMARRSVGPHDVSTAAGSFAWFAACRTIGEQMTDQGWKQHELKGLPLVTHPDTSVSIAITSGDHNTGNPDFQPKSKLPRGPQTFERVRENGDIPFLFEDPPLPTLPAEFERTTWWLLMHLRDNDVRAELSLPVDYSGDGRLSSWRTRIILNVPDLTLPPVRSRDEDEEPPMREIKVRPRR